MHFAWIAPLLLAAPDDSRRWEDEIVYVVIIEKFFDGDPSNNFMKDRFIKDRARYEGGFWGGDLKGVIDKLDDLADLGVTAILLYPVMQNDEGPGREVPADRLSPEGLRARRQEFRRRRDLALAHRRGPRPRDAGDPRHAHHPARIRAPVPRRPREEGLVRPPEPSTGCPAGRSRTPRSPTI